MKRYIPIVVSAVVLVLLLAGAAFVGGRLLRPAGDTDDTAGMVVTESDGQVVGLAKRVELISAAEVPNSPSDVAGIFVRREDNALFVGTGSTSFTIGNEEGGTPLVKASHDGPVLEVVITRDTQIYRDDTFSQFSGEPPEGGIQQRLSPGSLEEIGENSSVSAWGEKRGERLIADILVYFGSPVFPSR